MEKKHIGAKASTSYKTKILDFYQKNLDLIGEEVISFGYDCYQNNHKLQYFPISGFLKTRSKLILIEVETSKIIQEDETKKIIQEKFRPLSRMKDIIGIIESYKGFHGNVKSPQAFENYPLVLTKKNQIVSCNKQAQWSNIIQFLFFKSQFPDHPDVDSREGQPEIDYEMLAFILSGSVRKRIFVHLLKKPDFAYQIAREEGVNISSVFRALKEMKQRKVIKCITPKSTRKKFFQLTQMALLLKERVIKNH